MENTEIAQDENLDLLDLSPRETPFELSSLPGKPILLKPWSLRVRTWALARFGGSEKFNEIFKKREILAIAEIAFQMLKDKEQFKTLDDFLEMIQSPRDNLSVIVGLLGAIGIAEPRIDKIREMYNKKIQAGGEPDAPLAQSPSIGADSSIP